MTQKDYFICGSYAIVALAALPATWINNLAFMSQPSNSSFTDFLRAAYANAAAASLSNDLFLLAAAACIFMVIEGRRIGLRFVWVYLVISPLIAISVAFPLFLIARHLKLSQEPSPLSTTEAA
jgi:Terpene cyclase DEP1